MTYCVFNIGDRRVGLPMHYVREILEPRQILTTPVPHTPAFVRGLFNLRGQVLPYYDLATFVGAAGEAAAPRANGGTTPGADERALIVERGEFRFGMVGRRIDTVEADDAALQPLASGALHPALDGEARTEVGNFDVIHLDRLEACLIQSLKPSDPARAPEPQKRI